MYTGNSHAGKSLHILAIPHVIKSSILGNSAGLIAIIMHILEGTYIKYYVDTHNMVD